MAAKLNAGPINRLLWRILRCRTNLAAAECVSRLEKEAGMAWGKLSVEHAPDTPEALDVFLRAMPFRKSHVNWWHSDEGIRNLRGRLVVREKGTEVEVMISRGVLFMDHMGVSLAITISLVSAAGALYHYLGYDAQNLLPTFAPMYLTLTFCPLIFFVRFRKSLRLFKREAQSIFETLECAPLD